MIGAIGRGSGGGSDIKTEAIMIVGQVAMMDGDDDGESDGGNDNLMRVTVVTEMAVAYDIVGGSSNRDNSKVRQNQ